jgi:hypothetical protein
MRRRTFLTIAGALAAPDIGRGVEAAALRVALRAWEPGEPFLVVT